MPENVSNALETLAKYCLEQDNCSECSMREFCGKQPSEYQDLD